MHTIGFIKMKKLYLATRNVSTMFIAPDYFKTKDLEAEAERFLDEEIKCRGKSTLFPIDVKEITSIQDIPKEWQGDVYLWGYDGELTPTDFLSSYNDEYQEYLRLKAKYE